jgi:hypothetical protein
MNARFAATWQHVWRWLRRASTLLAIPRRVIGAEAAEFADATAFAPRHPDLPTLEAVLAGDALRPLAALAARGIDVVARIDTPGDAALGQPPAYRGLVVLSAFPAHHASGLKEPVP